VTDLVPQKVLRAGVYEVAVHPQLLAVPPPAQVLGGVQVKVPVLDSVVLQFVVTDLVSQKVLRTGVYELTVYTLYKINIKSTIKKCYI
jgi:transcription termination factor NusB